jgi:hypothetical protein
VYADAPAQLVAEYRAPAGGSCGSSPCWKKLPKGFRYRNLGATGTGLRKLVLRATTGPIADLKAVGRGPTLFLPPLPLPNQTVTVQLRRSDGGCWESLFQPPFKRNLSDSFKAKSEP